MRDRRRRAPIALSAVLTLSVAVPAAAQLTEAGTLARPPGWSVTPSIGVAEMWDDNPSLAAEADVPVGDFVTAVRPSLGLDFRGRRTTLRGNYAGTFDFYRNQTNRDRRDQRASLDLAHQVTRRVQLFVRNQALVSPTTTEAVSVGATVLRQQTTAMNVFQAGVDAVLGRQTTLSGNYESQWIEFASDDELAGPVPPVDPFLQGGYSHGAVASLRHRLNQRFSIGADYDTQRAIIGGGTDSFEVQSALAVSEVALTRSVSATVAYGHAWRMAGQNGFSDSGPAFNVGLDWQGRRTGGSVRYSRAFVPSFGFGGTFQNEELRASLRTSLRRWVQWSGSVALSNNDPIELGSPTLRFYSAQTSLGWTVRRQLRFDAFVEHVSQDYDYPGLVDGRVLRTRAGVQATVSQTVRATR